jgi:glycosyltransferase involved in cell wall biosynthesis
MLAFRALSGEPADITVVIPSFERTELALESLRSVLNQTQPVREIIVVANGSSDHTAFWEAQRSNRVRVVRESGRGQQAARNAGLRAATSTWVAILDDDDLYMPDFIRSVMPAIEDGRAEIVGTDHRKFRPHRQDRNTNFEAAPARYWRGIKPAERGVEWSFIGKFPLERVLQRVPIYPSTMVMKRDFALGIGGYDPRMFGIPSEDVEFLIRALTYGNLSLVWQPMVRYRIHTGNFSKNASARAVGRWRILEHVRECHPHLPLSFRRALDKDLPRRRRKILRLAYELGDWDLMQEVWNGLHPLQRTPDVLALRIASWFLTEPPLRLFAAH